jgi:hypothetical protein
MTRNLVHLVTHEQLFLSIGRAFWLFLPPPSFSWWFSASGIFLDASWSLHNVIAWIKVRPFLSRFASHVFIGTLMLAQPFWILEISANFVYFHGDNDLFLKTRPWEALCRDPWWLFAGAVLFWKMKKQYNMSIKEVFYISPRFGIMLIATAASVIFFVFDIIYASNALDLGFPSGIIPFWKFSTVFKCLVDCIILDDFKTAMDRLRAYKISHLGSFSQDVHPQTPESRNLVRGWEEVAAREQLGHGSTVFGGDPMGRLLPSVDDDSSMKVPEHAYSSPLHPATSWAPSSKSRQFGNATSAEIHDPKDIAPTALEDGMVKRVVPARVE